MLVYREILVLKDSGGYRVIKDCREIEEYRVIRVF